TGDWTGVMKFNDAILLSAFLTGTTEGAWMEYYYQNSGECASGMPGGAATFVESTINYKDRLLFYDSSRTATNYTSTLDPFYFSDGGEANIYWRSGWGTTDHFA